MADYGLLSGLGEGLKSFTQAYGAAKKDQAEQQYKNTMFKLLAGKEGFSVDEAGGLVETPEHQEQKKLGLLKTRSELSDYDVNTPYSQASRGLLKGALKQTHPEYTEEQLNTEVPEDLSSAQYQKLQGLLKPELSGLFALKGREAIAEAMKGRNEIYRGNLDLNRAKAAQGVAKNVNTDPTVKAVDMQQAAIAKGLDRLTSAQVMTPQMFNEVQIDLANAITGGRTAAQGTIHRVEMDNLASRFAALKQKLTSNPTDINNPAMKKYLVDTFTELKTLNKKIRALKVKNLVGQSSAAFGNKGPFGDVYNNLIENASGENQLVNPGALEVGTIEDGYEFMGGNPSDKKNWKKK